MRYNSRAITVVELLAVIFIAMMLATVIMPYLARAKTYGCGANCVNNLKQIGVAFRTWALDNYDRYPMSVSTNNGGTKELVKSGNVFPHFLVMSNELSTPRLLFCPEETDTNRVRANTFGCSGVVGIGSSIQFTSDKNLTYFLGVDASDEHPTRILMGDDNFTFDGLRLNHRLVGVWTNSPVDWLPARHKGQGTVCLADGRATMFTTQHFRKAIADSDMVATRLAMP